MRRPGIKSCRPVPLSTWVQTLVELTDWDVELQFDHRHIPPFVSMPEVWRDYWNNQDSDE